MKFSGLQIAQATRGVLHQGDHVGPLGTATRALPVGAWFVARAGERFDAHDMLDAAAAAGAGGAVLSRQAGWTGPWVQVADTTVALQDLGRCARTRAAQATPRSRAWPIVHASRWARQSEHSGARPAQVEQVTAGA